MKFFTLPALLAAALFGMIVAVPFLPLARTQSSLFALEAKMTSTGPGKVVLYYDTGPGFNETAVSRVNLTKSDTPLTYRLALPPGTYRAFRFDPIDREGTVNLSSTRVVGLGGRVIRDLAFRELKPVQHIQSLREHDGRLELIVAKGANDPQLHVDFTPPLVVSPSSAELTHGWLPRSAAVFAVLAALLFALDRTPRLRAAFLRVAAWLAARPARAVALTAAFAVIASAYPVVFLGKSYVSPNLGTVLLYDAYPTLPGSTSGETVDVKGSDVGAVMWSHLPISMIQHRALAQGELPLWNRYNSGGVPLLAQGQSMFGDPLHLFVIAANGASWAWDIKYLAAKWLFATALGLIVLRLASSASPPLPLSPSLLLPSLLIAFAAPFVGFFLYRINHPAIFSLCYAPAALYCWLRVSQSASRRDTTLWALGLVVANLALMNSGTVKEAYALLLCVNFSGACVLLSSAAPLRARLAKLAALALAGVIFALLTAPIWATFLTTLGRAYTSYNTASAFQIQPGLLLGAFDELFYRPIMAEERTFNPSVNFLILLGLVYFLATLRHHFTHRAALALAFSSLLPLSLAFGLVPPSWIVRLPFLSNIAHLDNTFTCALIVLWSVLAGVGFTAAARRLGTPEGRADLVIAGLLVLALVFAWIASGHSSHRQVFGGGSALSLLLDGKEFPVSTFVWGQLAALLAASVLLALVVHRTLARRHLTAASFLLVVLALTLLLWRTGFHASAVGFDAYTVRPTERVRLLAKSGAMEFLKAAQKAEPSRGFGFHGNFHPGWTGAYGLETIHGPDALVNPFMRGLITSVIAHPAIERWWDWRLYVDVYNAAAARPLFDALNVRYYLDLQSESDQGVLGRALKLVKTADLDIYESPTAWPRAFFTDRIEPYEQVAEFIAQIRTGDGRPFAAAERPELARTPALLALPRGLTGRTVTPASAYVLTENSTTFTVRATSAGVVVLNEVFWPGDFRAEVNGKKSPVLRLNHTFKGVTVDAPGDYRITIRYVPKNWPRNVALALVGAVLLAASLWFGLRAPRSPSAL
ncbi:MAG: hypothetical protein CK548_01355 [Opitutia bacterium]|nr:MAG: hypothetical protein CK548_01355 [Opitutae bacterium]